MSHYTEDLKECKEYSNILITAKAALMEAGFQIVEEHENELVVKGKKSEVKSIIHSLSIPKVIILLMISVTGSKKYTHIRKKIK